MVPLSGEEKETSPQGLAGICRVTELVTAPAKKLAQPGTPRRLPGPSSLRAGTPIFFEFPGVAESHSAVVEGSDRSCPRSSTL